MKFFLFYLLLFTHTLLYAEVFDDFQNLSISAVQNTFTNSNGDATLCTRHLATDSQFTLTQGNLHYDGSATPPNGLLTKRNELIYMTNSFDATTLSNFKINFREAPSSPFTVDIKMKSGKKIGIHNYIKNYQFNSTDSTQSINLLTTPGVDQNGNSNPWEVEDYTGLYEISLLMNTTNNSSVNFNISSIEIEAVPEPFSLISLAIGVTTSIKKRKKVGLKLNK